MLTSEIRHEVEAALLSFAWEQWSQMGILAAAEHSSAWAQDPEALLVFTFEVAKADPRLFDEVLDWLAANERLISVRRLRSLSRDPADRSLVEAVLGWLGQHRPKARFSRQRSSAPPPALQPLHDDGGFPIRRRDTAFAEYGWLRSATEPSGKAQAPDLGAPINFAFRMRELLGIGARAEVVRLLLTSGAPRPTASVLANSALYAKRNVQEVLNGLEQAGAVTVTRSGNEQLYTIQRAAWGDLLGVRQFPTHKDWPQLLAGLQLALRWLRHAADNEMSDYVIASAVRDLLEAVRGDFEYAGIVVPRRQTSAEAGADLVHVLREGVKTLGEEGAPRNGERPAPSA